MRQKKSDGEEEEDPLSHYGPLLRAIQDLPDNSPFAKKIENMNHVSLCLDEQSEQELMSMGHALVRMISYLTKDGHQLNADESLDKLVSQDFMDIRDDPGAKLLSRYLGDLNCANVRELGNTIVSKFFQKQYIYPDLQMALDNELTDDIRKYLDEFTKFVESEQQDNVVKWHNCIDQLKTDLERMCEQIKESMNTNLRSLIQTLCKPAVDSMPQGPHLNNLLPPTLEKQHYGNYMRYLYVIVGRLSLMMLEDNNKQTQRNTNTPFYVEPGFEETEEQCPLYVPLVIPEFEEVKPIVHEERENAEVIIARGRITKRLERMSGISNLDVKCVFDSSIQALSFVPLIRDVLLDYIFSCGKDFNLESLKDSFCLLLKQLWYEDAEYLEPHTFLAALRRDRNFYSQVNGCEQQEANELLISKLFDAFSDIPVTSNNKEHMNADWEMFRDLVQLQVNEKASYQLSLQIPRNSILSFEQLLHSQYNFDANTKPLKDHLLLVTVLPPVLIITLKRFTLDEKGIWIKNKTRVPYSFKLHSELCGSFLLMTW